MFGPTLGPLVPPLYRSVEVSDNSLLQQGGGHSRHTRVSRVSSGYDAGSP